MNGSKSLLLSEILGDSSWRILPLDAMPGEKFVADMKFRSLDTKMFPGHTVAHGYIYNDSRCIFQDGEVIRTSTVKRMFTVGDEHFIETRNTIYRLI